MSYFFLEYLTVVVSACDHIIIYSIFIYNKVRQCKGDWKMFKKGLLFFLAIFLLGFLDWLTTMIGILFLDSAEINPFLSGITRSSMLIFSLVKLSAVILAGCAFYKAEAIYELTMNHWHYTKSLLYGGFSLMLLAFTGVVANNMPSSYSLSI